MPSPYNLEVFYSCEQCKLHRMFCTLGDDALKTLDSIKFTGVYPKGAVLFVEGEEPRGVFILCSGRAKITSSSSEGKKLILKLAEPGELLGLSAAVLGKPYEVSAETVEPAQVNFIRREDFLRFLAHYGEASMHTAQQLSVKYHAAQREIRSLGLAHSTADRLARLLLDWSDASGEGTPGGIRIKVLLTHEEIAQMIGTTRETVTRLLSEWRRRKIIEVRGSTVLIPERTNLEKLVTF